MNDGAVLNHPRDYGALLRGPVGRLIARPWLDQVTIGFMAASWLPMSRVWAAAILADGDTEVFLDNVTARHGTIRPGTLTVNRLRATASAARALAAAEAVWEDEFFGTVGENPGRAVKAETDRRDRANNLSLHRLWYAWIASRHGVEPCRWAIPDRDRMMDELGFMLGEPEAGFPWRPERPVTESSRLRSSLGTEFWLRLPATPDIPDVGRQPCTARVFVPDGFGDGPTVILLHGICMESEQWRLPMRDVEVLVKAGVRVVMPEGPWHGRRRPAGLYGGEPVVASAPRGAIDYFRAHGPEVGRLIQWCRQSAPGRVAGPVGVMGISLGSFVVQLVSTMSRNWPADSRPDAAFLVATAERIDEIGISGAFGRAFRLDRALARAGWTAGTLAEWGRVSQGMGDPVIRRENVFALLGSEDEVTPYSGGRSLVERWGVPAENVTIRPQGHFSVAAGMMVDDSPTRAFVERLFTL